MVPETVAVSGAGVLRQFQPGPHTWAWTIAANPSIITKNKMFRFKMILTEKELLAYRKTRPRFSAKGQRPL
jgi:hypothetical protein